MHGLAIHVLQLRHGSTTSLTRSSQLVFEAKAHLHYSTVLAVNISRAYSMYRRMSKPSKRPVERWMTGRKTPKATPVDGLVPYTYVADTAVSAARLPPALRAARASPPFGPTRIFGPIGKTQSPGRQTLPAAEFSHPGVLPIGSTVSFECHRPAQAGRVAFCLHRALAVWTEQSGRIY